MGIDTRVIEAGGIMTRYMVFDYDPWDIENRKKDIVQTWEKNRLPNSEKKRIGVKWFEDRRKGIHQSWFSYVQSMESEDASRYRINLHKDKVNVAVFISSEDELYQFKQWRVPFFGSQTSAMKFLFNTLRDRKVHFFVRIHPNLKDINNSQTKELMKFGEMPNATLIPADSELNSYALCEMVDKVLTFGSTMGIEAAFWGKVSILFGRAEWEHLNSVYTPSSKEELIQMILSDDLRAPAPKDNDSIKYGFWQMTRGKKYRYYEPINPSEGTLFGKYIHDIDKNLADYVVEKYLQKILKYHFPS